MNGAAADRGPKHSNLEFLDVDGQALMMNLDLEGVQASSGSACSSGSQEPSPVLLAMGLSEARARASVRFSFGPGLSDALVEEAAERVRRAAQRSSLHSSAS